MVELATLPETAEVASCRLDKDSLLFRNPDRITPKVDWEIPLVNVLAVHVAVRLRLSLDPNPLFGRVAADPI